MNQILSTNNDNNNYNKKDTKKVIVIFCMALIIVATAIILLKVYSIYKNKQARDNYKTPEITITEVSNSQVSIKVLCEDGIDYIIYTWNETNEKKINLNGSTTFERIIDMPYNKNNILKVETVTQNGIKAEKQNSFGMEVDEEKPVIDSITTKGSTLKIEASDNSGVAYIEYKWEDEEPSRIDIVAEDNKKVNAEINIKRGTYKLTITAVDIYGNKEKISKLVTGVNEPEIFVVRYGDVINIKATHDMGIKQISVLINDELYIYNEESEGYSKQTTAEVEYPLEAGENVVKIIVHSYEKLSKEDDESLKNYSSKSFVGTTIN